MYLSLINKKTFRIILYINEYVLYTPKPKINSEFNSMHLGIEINKHQKLLTPISFWV